MDLENLSAGDGESSVSDSEPGTPLPPERVAAVLDASYEIQQVAEALQDLIEARDSCGEVRTISRGMLRRIAALSDAIHTCLNGECTADELSSASLIVRGLA